MKKSMTKQIFLGLGIVSLFLAIVFTPFKGCDKAPKNTNFSDSTVVDSVRLDSVMLDSIKTDSILDTL